VKVRRNDVDGVGVIYLEESTDIEFGNCDEFGEAVAGLLRADDRNMVLDGSRIDFFDSAGMGSLLSLQKRLEKQGGHFVLAALNRSVEEVFNMVGFDVLFSIFRDVTGAVNSFRTTDQDDQKGNPA